MSVAEITYQPTGSAQVLSPAQFSPHLAPASGWQISINVPAFDVSITSKVISIRNEDDYRHVAVESFVDPSVSALLNLTNEPLDGDTENLAIRNVNLAINVTDHRPRAVFIAGSLYSMLGLARRVNISIPGAQVDLGLYFPMELSEISGLLQGRQTSFGLMVIEKATGLKIEIPENETEADRSAISFAYCAITEREFVWPTYEVIMPMVATDRSLAWIDNLPPNGSTYALPPGPHQRTITIFGQTVALGDHTASMEDAIIDDRENVRRELAKRDGHVVRVTMRSLTRKVRYVFANPPQLPTDPWDEKIEGFIKLEDKLNELLTARYHELAASTVADLTPEEFDVVTSRTELDGDAFLIRD